MEEKNTPNYFGILPANVRYDKRLKPMEKILYTEITALANIKGYCYATNSYFANLYDVHKNTAGTWINNLERLGYIKSKIIYEAGTKNIKERRLFLFKHINESIDTYQQKDCDPINKKMDTPINENIEDNNTRYNNIIEYNYIYKSEKFQKTFLDFLEMRKKIKPPPKTNHNQIINHHHTTQTPNKHTNIKISKPPTTIQNTIPDIIHNNTVVKHFIFPFPLKLTTTS